MTGAIITPAFLSSIRATPHLPKHILPFLVGAVCSTLNLPHEIPHVVHFALENDGGQCHGVLEREEQLLICTKMREAIIKLAPIAGLPKSINAMNFLKSATPPSLLDHPLGVSPTGRAIELYDVPSSNILDRGQKYFSKTYGKVARHVMSSMDRSGTEDLGIIARLMYGYVLSNTSVLNAQESSYVLLAGLIPQDVNAQLKGHLRGALNHGSTVEEVKAVREVVIRVCVETSGMRRLNEGVSAGWGWRGAVADL